MVVGKLAQLKKSIKTPNFINFFCSLALGKLILILGLKPNWELDYNFYTKHDITQNHLMLAEDPYHNL